MGPGIVAFGLLEADSSLTRPARGYKARHNLAVIYQEQGRAAEAEAQWKAVAAERPGFAPARRGLGELYTWRRAVGRRSRRSRPTSPAARPTSRRPPSFAPAPPWRGGSSPPHAACSRGRSRAPQSLKPRVVLSHALLQEGREPRAAERALRDVLALDPLKAEARHNLSVLPSRPDPPPVDPPPMIDQ